MNIDSFDIIKELGYGGYGTVYLVEKDEEYYALKIEKILEKDIKRYIDYETPNYYHTFSSSPLYNEIDFATNFANKNPRFFMQLKAWDVVDNCQYKNKYNNESLTPLQKSKYCSRKIYSLVDGTLTDLLSEDKINREAIRSLWIQYVYATYLLDEAGYVLPDTHGDNIGYIKTNKKYIYLTIDSIRKRIPTYGYQIQLIDYGIVVNIRNAKPTYKNNSLLSAFADFIQFHEILDNKPLPINSSTFKKYPILKRIPDDWIDIIYPLYFTKESDLVVKPLLQLEDVILFFESIDKKYIAKTYLKKMFS